MYAESKKEVPKLEDLVQGRCACTKCHHSYKKHFISDESQVNYLREHEQGKA